MNKASCLSLLSNAVLVWNTVHIARIVDQLRAAGHEVKAVSYTHLDVYKRQEQRLQHAVIGGPINAADHP